MKKIITLFLVLLYLSAPVYAEERYTFETSKDTKLKNVLFGIARQANRDIVVNIKGDEQVLVALNNITVEEAFDILSKSYNFNWTVDDSNRIIVAPPDSMTESKRFILKCATLENVKKELLNFVPDAKITINPEYNAISVEGTNYVIQKAEKKIREIDVPVDRFMVVSQMIEVSRNDMLKIGFQYTTPGYDNSVRPFKAQFTVTSNLNQEFNNGNVIARPTITTVNGVKATMLVGDKVPYFSSTSTNGTVSTEVKFEEVGAKLEVTPYLNDREKQTITMDLDTTVSSVSKWITSGSMTAPQIATRTAKTKIRVASGDSIVIGGLIRQSDIDNLVGIPGLMDLPILGKLFQYRNKSKENTEVFIVITPYLLNDDTDSAAMQKILRDNNSNKKVDDKKEKGKDILIKKEPAPTTKEPVKKEEKPVEIKPYAA